MAATVGVTTGEIARQLGEPIHRIEYVLKSREIEPIGNAGRLRVFDDQAVEEVADALREIDRKRGGV